MNQSQSKQKCKRNRDNWKARALKAEADLLAYDEVYRRVINEKTHTNADRHCTCVPWLRMEIDRLKNALNDIAAYEARHPGSFVTSYRMRQIAKAALKPYPPKRSDLAKESQ